MGIISFTFSNRSVIQLSSSFQIRKASSDSLIIEIRPTHDFPLYSFVSPLYLVFITFAHSLARLGFTSDSRQAICNKALYVVSSRD